MTLKQYIKQMGVSKICKIYRVSRSTVNQWRVGKNFPRPKTGEKIVKTTMGLVDWAGIYGGKK